MGVPGINAVAEVHDVRSVFDERAIICFVFSRIVVSGVKRRAGSRFPWNRIPGCVFKVCSKSAPV